jgi:hypothetical protein
MAKTEGYVQKVGIVLLENDPSSIACFWIGPSVFSSSQLDIFCKNADSSQERDIKNSMIDALVTAKAARLRVEVGHVGNNINHVALLEG